MKKIKWFFGILFVLTALLWSCNEDMLNPDGSLDMTTLKSTTTIPLADGTPIEACGTATFDLIAGQTIDAGDVVVSNDATTLYITVTSTAGFQDKEGNIKMWIGTDFTSATTLDGGGIQRPNQFPIHIQVPVGVTSYTYTLPLNNNAILGYAGCPQLLYIVVHADVLVGSTDGSGTTTVKGETAFSNGNTGSEVGKKSWWFYSTYTTQCCLTTPPDPTGRLETAFAKGGYVFTTDRKSNPENLPTLGLTKNRWGWASKLIARTEDYVFPIYAGAGLNKLSNGVLVGTATVNFNGGFVTVKYDLAVGYSLTEVHIYQGMNAPTTLAPGLYGFTEYFNPTVNDSPEYSFELPLEERTGERWIILHAVVSL
jgi:hypothetical protein